MRKAKTRAARPRPRIPVQRKDTKLTPRRGEVVAFEVLCHPRSGAERQEVATELTLSTVERYSPEERTIAGVEQILQRLGFRVLGEDNGTSVSAEGPYELFEKTFNTALRKRGRSLTAGGRTHSFEFFDTEPDAPRPNVRNVPGAIDVGIVRPPIYFESPLPPAVRYHHLRVPGDVAMLTRASAAHRRSKNGQRATGAGVRVAQ